MSENFRLIAISIVFCSQYLTSPCLADDNAALTLKQGNWPTELKLIQGKPNKAQKIVFSTEKIVVEEKIIESNVIAIDEHTRVYVPKGSKIFAQPKVYQHPELSDEVQKFYVQGIGNYAFWAFMVGLAAAFQ